MITIIRLAFNGMLTPWKALAMAGAFLLAIAICMTAHELAHGIAAYRCGDLTAKYSGRLSPNPLKHFDPIGFLLLIIVGFGWAKPVPINPNNFTKSYKSSMIKVSLAGIATNLVLAFLLQPLALTVQSFMPYIEGVKDFFYYFFVYAVSVNISLAVFNLLPIYPLDGYNFLETVLPRNNRFLYVMRRYGQIILLVVFLLSSFVLSFLIEKVGWPIYAFWNWIFGFII